MSTTALAKSKPRRLTKTQLQQLSTYTDPGVILNVLKAAGSVEGGWTIKRAIDELVKIVETTDKDSTRLAALKYLNQMIIDCMERSGMMVIATKKIAGEEGEEVTFTGHMVSSVLQGPSDEQTTIEQLTEGDYPQDVKEIENDKKTKPRKQKKTKRTAKRPENRGRTDSSPNERRVGRGNKEDKQRSTTDGGIGRSTSGTTEAGLSDDLHSSKYPQAHLDDFQGLAIPPGTKVSGPADRRPDAGATATDDDETGLPDHL